MRHPDLLPPGQRSRRRQRPAPATGGPGRRLRSRGGPWRTCRSCSRNTMCSARIGKRRHTHRAEGSPLRHRTESPVLRALHGCQVLAPPGRPTDSCSTTRASYDEETAALVRYLLDVRKIPPETLAVFAQQDAYGDAGFEGVARTLRQRGFDPDKLFARRLRPVTRST